METNLKKISGSERELTFVLTEEEVKPTFDKAYREIQKKTELKGFRKGKAPIKLIKQLYGKSVELDVIEELAQRHFENYAKETEAKVVGAPRLTDYKIEDGSYSITINFDELPEFELKEYKGLQIEEPVHIVSDEEIEEKIDEILKYNGSLEPAEEITDYLYVAKIELEEIDKETKEPIEGAKKETIDVFLESDKTMPAFKESLLNKKIGDEFEFNPKESDEYSPDKLYKCKIIAINKLVPKELTNEFVKEYTQGKFETIEEFKEDIGFKLQEEWDAKSRDEMETQIIDKLVAEHEFDPPPSVVSQTANAMADDVVKRYKDRPEFQNLNKDLVAGDLTPLAEKTVRWEIIREKIVEKEKIEIEDYDLDELLTPYQDLNEEQKAQLRDRLRTNDKLINQILGKKVIDLLIDFAETSEIPFEDYLNKKQMKDIEKNEKNEDGEAKNEQEKTEETESEKE